MADNNQTTIPANPQVIAGLQAAGASGGIPVSPAVPNKSPVQIVQDAQAAQAPELLAIQQQQDKANKASDASLAELGAAPKLPDQQFKFTPPENSGMMASLMMVMGALGGRKTMQPATAALNNMTGMMKGLHERDLEAYKQQKDEYDKNYQAAKDHIENYYNEVKAIHEQHGYDIAKTKPLLDMAALKYGQSLDIYKAKETADKLDTEKKYHDDDMKLKVQEHKDSVNERMAQINMEHQRLSEQIRHDRETEGDKQPFVKLADGTTRRLYQGETTLPAGATLTSASSQGKSQHATVAEEKARMAESYVKMANDTLSELDAKGVRVPVSTEMFGNLYDPKTGGFNQVYQQKIRDSLSTTEEKQAFISSLNYVIGVGHALGGARPSQQQMAAIWNSDIPSPYDPKEIVDYKQKVRANMLESIQKATGEDRGSSKKVVRTGMLGGRKVIQYDDGTTEYAN